MLPPQRAFLLLTLLAVAPRLGAQTGPTEIARRDLIQQAEAARDVGDHARALDLTLRAAQIRVTTSLRVLLAQLHDALGHVLDALDQATTCVREAEADVTLRNRDRILATCTDLVATLTPRVGHVVVRVPSPPPGLVVRVADTEVNPALWGTPYPVVPGTVVVEVGGQGFFPAREVVEVRPGETRDVRPAVRRAPDRAGEVPPARTPPPAPVSGGPGAGPWVLAAVGATALGAATAAWLVSGGALQDRRGACTGGDNPCDPLATTYDTRYRTFAYLGDAALVVGAAGVVSGVLWYLVAHGRAEAPPSSLRVTLRPTSGGAALGLGGAL